MYYLVSGRCGGLMEYDGVDYARFDWIIKADTEAAAREEAQKSLQEGDQILQVKPIGVEERLERVKAELYSIAIGFYDNPKYENFSVREYAQLKKTITADEKLEDEFDALVYFNCLVRMAKQLTRKHELDDMTLGKFIPAIKKIAKASPDEFEAAVRALVPDYFEG